MYFVGGILGLFYSMLLNASISPTDSSEECLRVVVQGYSIHLSENNPQATAIQKYAKWLYLKTQSNYLITPNDFNEFVSKLKWIKENDERLICELNIVSHGHSGELFFSDKIYAPHLNENIFDGKSDVLSTVFAKNAWINIYACSIAANYQGAIFIREMGDHLLKRNGGGHIAGFTIDIDEETSSIMQRIRFWGNVMMGFIKSDVRKKIVIDPFLEMQKIKKGEESAFIYHYEVKP